jgi:hypothetical protein
VRLEGLGKLKKSNCLMGIEPATFHAVYINRIYSDFVLTDVFHCSGTMYQLKIAAVTLLCLVATASVDLHIIRRPSFVGCVDSSECHEEQCCVLGGYPGLMNAPRCDTL